MALKPWKSWDPKGPNEEYTYHIEWTLDAGDSISEPSIEWTVPEGLTKGTESLVENRTYIEIGGGTVGQAYALHCQLETANGNKLEQSVALRIRNK